MLREGQTRDQAVWMWYSKLNKYHKLVDQFEEIHKKIAVVNGTGKSYVCCTDD